VTTPLGIRRIFAHGVTTPVPHPDTLVTRPPAAGTFDQLFGDAMIELRQLTKRYRSTLAVDHLSFDVKPGQVTAFLGPNGAGKSTTMRMILGLDAPEEGHSRINGRRYASLRWPIREVGALLDADAVHPGRSAGNHLLSIGRANQMGRRRVAEVLELTGLTSVASKRVGGFSLGMKQRLGIAAALLGDPGVLVLDEPVNGLDTEGIQWIRGLLQELAAQGRTVLVSSHLMTEMQQIADHLIVIGRGKLIADSPTAEFISSSALGKVHLRAPRVAELVPLLTARGGTVTLENDHAASVTGLSTDVVADVAAAHRLPLHELTQERPSLEYAYLKHVDAEIEYRATPSDTQAKDVR
jgi:ABC-2 type transport system ATP-binding protein